MEGMKHSSYISIQRLILLMGLTNVMHWSSQHNVSSHNSTEVQTDRDTRHSFAYQRRFIQYKISVFYAYCRWSAQQGSILWYCEWQVIFNAYYVHMFCTRHTNSLPDVPTAQGFCDSTWTTTTTMQTLMAYTPTQCNRSLTHTHTRTHAHTRTHTRTVHTATQFTHTHAGTAPLRVHSFTWCLGPSMFTWKQNQLTDMYSLPWYSIMSFEYAQE